MSLLVRGRREIGQVEIQKQASYTLEVSLVEVSFGIEGDTQTWRSELLENAQKQR